MSATESRKIVVGLDRSVGGRRALTWALGEARRRGAELHVVTAWHWDGIEEAFLGASNPTEAREAAERHQREALDEALSDVAQQLPPIVPQVLRGDSADVLVHAGQDAELLVVASHGRRGRQRRAPLGSVSARVVQHATCPVVVVPVPHAERGKDTARTAEHSRR
ncbi:universal stress protein [Nocardioides gansuensis]|uniref:Universal stress protein n=1 Tax=Nocardioides gansuensis TaxID=2138300 RepID=A0A2T8F8Z9_9ACTN|nr:universal stress protein [Nocardioides gansuensis]PVG82204.1 universal stress protein [Nocardioides gansuensis]